MGNNALLFLHAQTPLHPGAGQAEGIIDLPIQRERHTGWPMIAGSGIKGVLRDYARSRIMANGAASSLEEADKNPCIETVFGPSLKGKEAHKHAGALAQPEAAILFFPVRSLKGLFAWVTCPTALERFNHFADMAKLPDMRPCADLFGSLASSMARISDISILGIPQNGSTQIVLEEYRYDAEKSENLEKFAKTFQQKLSGLDKLPERIALIDDDSFTTITRHSMQFGMRNALDYETKTTHDTALFYCEDMPAETVLYSFLSIDTPRSNHDTLTTPENVLRFLNNSHTDGGLGLGTGQYMQFGGHATVGKGICRVTLCWNAQA